MLWEYAAGAAGVLLVFGIVAAAAFEQGRAHMAKELKDSWIQARCRECGAVPAVRLTHVSGCESGWPDPATAFEELAKRRGP